jgi:hypothetical protein
MIIFLSNLIFSTKRNLKLLTKFNHEIIYILYIVKYKKKYMLLFNYQWGPQL